MRLLHKTNIALPESINIRSLDRVVSKALCLKVNKGNLCMTDVPVGRLRVRALNQSQSLLSGSKALCDLSVKEFMIAWQMIIQ